MSELSNSGVSSPIESKYVNKIASLLEEDPYLVKNFKSFIRSLELSSRDLNILRHEMTRFDDWAIDLIETLVGIGYTFEKLIESLRKNQFVDSADRMQSYFDSLKAEANREDPGSELEPLINNEQTLDQLPDHTFATSPVDNSENCNSDYSRDSQAAGALNDVPSRSAHEETRGTNTLEDEEGQQERQNSKCSRNLLFMIIFMVIISIGLIVAIIFVILHFNSATSKASKPDINITSSKPPEEPTTPNSTTENSLELELRNNTLSLVSPATSPYKPKQIFQQEEIEYNFNLDASGLKSGIQTERLKINITLHNLGPFTNDSVSILNHNKVDQWYALQLSVDDPPWLIAIQTRASNLKMLTLKYTAGLCEAFDDSKERATLTSKKIISRIETLVLQDFLECRDGFELLTGTFNFTRLKKLVITGLRLNSVVSGLLNDFLLKFGSKTEVIDIGGDLFTTESFMKNVLLPNLRNAKLDFNLHGKYASQLNEGVLKSSHQLNSYISNVPVEVSTIMYYFGTSEYSLQYLSLYLILDEPKILLDVSDFTNILKNLKALSCMIIIDKKTKDELQSNELPIQVTVKSLKNATQTSNIAFEFRSRYEFHVVNDGLDFHLFKSGNLFVLKSDLSDN